MKIVCFHNPEEENGYLSNWYSSQFIINDIIFSSMEQFMMYQKAICFEDNDIAQKILKTENGRLISNYNENYWNGIRQIIVFEGLMAKFSQNESLKRQLQETEHCILAECAVKDKIWGIGLSMGDPDRLEISKWKGQNLLGYTLMMVRDWL